MRKGDDDGATRAPSRRFLAVATVSSEPDASILLFEILDASDLGTRRDTRLRARAGDGAAAAAEASFSLALHDMVRVRGGGGAKEMLFVPDAKRGALLAVVTAARSVVFVDAWDGEVVRRDTGGGGEGSAGIPSQRSLDRCWRVFNGARVSAAEGALAWRYGSNGLSLLQGTSRSGVEFDHEVYVMGVHPATNMLLGVTQRASVPLPQGRSPNAICAPCVSLPIFEVECHLQACAHVAIYEMIVQHMEGLKKGGSGGEHRNGASGDGSSSASGVDDKDDDDDRHRDGFANKVAAALLRLPECARVMELLLFAALELAHAGGNGSNKAGRALGLTLSLLRGLPRFRSVVANLARKVEPEKWSLLFDGEAFMRPQSLFQEALEHGDLSSAISLLRIMYVRGPRKGTDARVFQGELRTYAERVEKAAGTEQPELVASLRRFLGV